MNTILESEKARTALRWIIQLLRKHHIDYQITGGLAAKVYGVTRPLIDIDIDVPNKAIAMILAEAKNYVVYSSNRYKDHEWDILLVTLEYAGMSIDLSGADDGLIFDKKEDSWVKCEVNLKTAILTPIDGEEIPIIARDSLIKYKSILNRAVDSIDLKEMLNNGTPIT